MQNSETVLIEMYKEHTAMARHHEAQRSTIATICFAIAGALIGVMWKDDTLRIDGRFLPAALTTVGLLGALLSWKHYERNRMHTRIAAAFRDKISTELCSINSKAREAHKRKYKMTSRLHLHWLWTLLFIAVAIFGIVLLIRGPRGW